MNPAVLWHTDSWLGLVESSVVT